MYKPVEILDNLWSFRIELPNSSLKWLNCYVIKGKHDERNLLIDTGFNLSKCRQDLDEGIAALGLKPESTDVFLTHLHADHIGLAGYLQSLGYRLFMSELDYQVYWNPNIWTEACRLAYEEGAPSQLCFDPVKGRELSGITPTYFTAELLQDGDILSYGQYNLQCISTPGHTPGHMCLYDKEHSLMLLGDHVLFDISPNISALTGMLDPVSDYLHSLEKIRSYKVRYALPSHRDCNTMSLNTRIDDLKIFCYQRLDEVRDIVRDNPGLTAYEIAGRISWHMGSNSWDELPKMQKWAAFGECLAFLRSLLISGKLKVALNGERFKTYYIDGKAVSKTNI